MRRAAGGGAVRAAAPLRALDDLDRRHGPLAALMTTVALVTIIGLMLALAALVALSR
jgi:hypothetical protein